MQIVSFSVSGFRSLEEVEDIPVRKPTILVGPNDGGKSASLMALSFLLGKYHPNPDDLTVVAISSDSLGQKPGFRRANQVAVTGKFKLTDAEAAEFCIPTDLTIRRSYQPDGDASLEMRASVCEEPRLRGLKEMGLQDLKALAKDFDLAPEGAANIKASWVAPLENLSQKCATVDEWITVPARLEQRLPFPIVFRGDDAPDPEMAIKDALAIRFRKYIAEEEVTSALERVSEGISRKLAEDAEEIRNHIAERCHLQNVTIEPEINIKPALSTPKMRLEDSQGKSIALGSFGTGSARRVSLAAWESSSGLLKRTTREADEPEEGLGETDVVVIYDEPDTHLDYNHQRRVMDLVREQCRIPNVRIMIATHSLNLIDGVDIGDIVQVYSDGTTKCQVIVETPDDVVERKLMTDLAAALGFRNSVLIHERFFVGVEGITEQQAFPVLFRTYTGRSLQSSGICLWPCGNNEGALNFASFLRVNNRAVAFVVDNDSTLKRNDLFHEDRLRRFGLDPNEHCQYIGDPMELEDVFEAELWCAAADDLWPRNDGAQWNPQDVEELRGEKKFSEKLWLLFAESSDKAPRGKAEMMFGLATWISRPDQIPAQLCQVFDFLIAKADLSNTQGTD